MTTAVLDRPATLFEAPPATRALTPKAAGMGGRPTLEDAITGVWEGLAAHRAVACLVCGGRMSPRYGAAGHVPVGGRCADCGSTLG
jgi:hypothetical protein